MLNPTVLTATQEREQKTGVGFGSNWNGKGTHMWRLKQEKPELFERQEGAEVAARQEAAEERPPGFEACQLEGWLYSKEKNVFFQKSTRQRFWYDEAGSLHRPLREGESQPVSFVGGGAAAVAAPGGDGAGCGAAGGTAGAAPKHLVISDLHRAAKALKVDLGHLDRPAGALAIIGAAVGGGVASTAPPDAAARLLPEKLLRRLAAFRSEWPDQMLCGAVAGALEDVSAGLGGSQSIASLALLVGYRVAVGATPGARARICNAARPAVAGVGVVPGPTCRATPSATIAPSAGESMATGCRKLGEDALAEALLVTLTVGEGDTDGADGQAAMVTHLLQGRPRAASLALLKIARRKGPLTIACARLGPPCTKGSASSEATSSSATVPPAKRQKTDEAMGKVRLRQILLRHAPARRPDPVRRRPVARTVEEAEAQMLDVLDGLVADGCASFPSVCKAISECQSSLKGGEMAGDLGWLDRKASDAQQDSRKALKVDLPANVLKVAFELAVGELGDVVTSDIGVHLIQRTA